MIRRATLDIPIGDGFKSYTDPSADDYDKIIISNNTITEGVRSYAMAPAPTQLYPDYHPAFAADGDSGSQTAPKSVPPLSNEPVKNYQRKSASESPDSESGIQLKKADEFQ